MKLTYKAFAAAAAILAAGAFGTTAADATTVALVTINQQALFFNQINDGAKASADKNGVKLVIFNANNQAAAQNSATEDYITQTVDGIVLVAIDVNGVKPVSRITPKGSMETPPPEVARKRTVFTTAGLRDWWFARYSHPSCFRSHRCSSSVAHALLAAHSHPADRAFSGRAATFHFIGRYATRLTARRARLPAGCRRVARAPARWPRTIASLRECRCGKREGDK